MTLKGQERWIFNNDKRWTFDSNDRWIPYLDILTNYILSVENLQINFKVEALKIIYSVEFLQTLFEVK